MQTPAPFDDRRRKLPRTRDLCVRALLATCALLGHVAPASAAQTWLEGDWYVLVHFGERAPDAGKDAGPTPGGTDYRDAVWRFERAGDGLRWTIFPDVAFRDETGRFEEVGGARARLRHAWRPSVAQLAEIRSGPSVDPRTARTKTLRPRGRAAYASGGGARAGSASAVAYGETWEIESLDEAPVFTRSASLSSGRADRLEGVTRLEADVVDVEAGRLEGAYRRDETEVGRFIMWKKGAVRADDAAFAAAADDRSLFGPGGAARTSVASLQSLLDRAAAPGAREDPALRAAIRAEIEDLVRESYARRGRSLRADRAEIDRVSREIERLCVVEGVALAEIDRRYAAGELVP